MNKSTNINNLNSFKSENFDWKLIQSEMKNKLGQDVYESWLKKISFVDEFNNYLLLSVPTRFIRDWITSRYCLLYTSPSPRDVEESRMPSSA